MPHPALYVARDVSPAPESNLLVAPANRPSFSLRGRTAVVTGAAGVLGREHCLALGMAGANVVATDLDAEASREVARELESHDIQAVAVTADVTDPRTLEDLREAVLARFGAVDVLVNSAAVDDKFDPLADLAASRFETYSLERWRRSLDVNVTGTFLCCQVLGAEMAHRGRGSIVNIASTYGMVAPDQSLYEDAQGTQRFFKSPAYPTSKAAVFGLTRYLAAYWGRIGVRVNTLSPGGVQAGQSADFVAKYGKRTPLGRMARRDEYHGALVFLASDASSYMTGANLVVDGGWTTW
jgi:NAD(P)-dependent dehydrogenase (short-subunit alcohol dehydrogenase family)